MNFWKFIDLYLRWVIDQSQTKSMFNQIQGLITHEKELRSKVIFVPVYFYKTK